jgi:hypothetical protein
MQVDEKALRAVAIAISGAPFPSSSSLKKARAAILAYEAAKPPAPEPAPSPAAVQGSGVEAVRTGADMIARHRFRLADDGNCAEIDSFGLAEEIDAVVASLSPAPTSGSEAGGGFVTISLADAIIVRNVFLPRNPNRMRGAHPDTIAAAHAFNGAVALCAREEGRDV